jgi:thymidylate synthase (FAD)|tara:strand:+ start:129 stop:1052 length:924 start_codon:yes stop_codon:yes gene_type:complete
MQKKNKKNKSNLIVEPESKTKRVTVSKIESILYKPFKVLDHGFIRVIDYMGDDSSIVQAARVSYGKGTKKLNQDKNLINYLLSHQHTTPFEMNEIKLHIKLPMFVARQWIRHRTANVNEYSARYSILDNEFYIPKIEDLKPQSKINNQGRSGEIEKNLARHYLSLLRDNSKINFSTYHHLLNLNEDGDILDENREGIARELARMILPVNSYTQWYWKIDLHNLMHFLALRFDPHAQYEIRVYADVMIKILKKWVPLTYEAFVKNRLNSFTLSSEAIQYVKQKLKNKKADNSKLSKRELETLNKVLDL